MTQISVLGVLFLLVRLMNQQVESIGRWVAAHNRIELFFKQLQYSFDRAGEVIQEALRSIARKQLDYQNPEVVAYVQSVRRQYMIRKYPAMRPPRSSTP